MRDSSTGKLQGVSHSFASLPFGFGSRSCIGKKIAEIEMEYLIQQFHDNFHIQILNDKPVNMAMRMIGLPDSRITFRLTRKYV